MLKCDIKKDHRIKVQASGTAYDLMLETGTAIQQIYQNILKQNPEAAKDYKLYLLGVLLDPESPVWKEPPA